MNYLIISKTKNIFQGRGKRTDIQERSLKINEKKKKTNKETKMNESLDGICDIACL